MKPLNIELDLLQPKLDSLARCIERIESKRPFLLKELESNFDLQDVISLNIERAVQQCVDIATMILSRSESPLPGDMADCFIALQHLNCISEPVAIRMKKSVGFRNIMVHEYEKMNWEIVFQIVEKHLNDLREFAREILVYCKSN